MFFLFNSKFLPSEHSEVDKLLDIGVLMDDAMPSLFTQPINRAFGADNLLAVKSQIIETRDNEIYLLCSGGLNKELSDEEIAKVLATNPPEDIVQVMLNMAISRRGQDNITVMAVYKW